MSNTQLAFIERSRVPDRMELQSSIDALGFDLKLDQDFTRFDDSGFLPFVLNGEEGFGFEIGYQDSCKIIEDDQELLALAGGRDYCISMTLSSSMNDLACVMIVSCALAKDFDAVVSYEGEPSDTLKIMLESTQDILKEGAGEEPPTVSEAPMENNTVSRSSWWKFW